MKEKVKCNASNGAVYGFGFIGSAIYFIGKASGFVGVIIGFIKALVWPAYIAYGLLKMLEI